MRSAFIFSLLLFTNLLFSQNKFAEQLNQIIKDSANNFGRFKREFKEMRDKDSVFYSLTILEGTSKNDIVVTQVLTQYRCEIIDSINERKGKAIVDEWHEKLLNVLGSRFNAEKAKIVSWTPVKYGWSFNKGNTWIDIGLLPVNVNSTKYFVSIAITYFSEDFYKLK